jgi:hypothetical protein
MTPGVSGSAEVKERGLDRMQQSVAPRTTAWTPIVTRKPLKQNAALVSPWQSGARISPFKPPSR